MFRKAREVARAPSLAQRLRRRFSLGKPTEVRLRGNIAAHEDVPPEHRGSADVEQLLEFLGLLLETVNVQPAQLEALKAKRSQSGGGSVRILPGRSIQPVLIICP